MYKRQFFAQFVNETLKVGNVAILHDNTTFGKGLAEAARASLEKANKAKIVFYDVVTPGERDFTPILTRMHRANPDVLYFTGYYPEAGLIIRQMRDLGSQAIFVGGNAAINDEFVEIAGKDVAKGALMTQEDVYKRQLYDTSSETRLNGYIYKHAADVDYQFIPPDSDSPGALTRNGKDITSSRVSVASCKFDYLKPAQGSDAPKPPEPSESLSLIHI